MADRRIRKYGSLSEYLRSLDQDVTKLNNRNYVTSIAANAIGSDQIGENIVLDNKTISSSNYISGFSGWIIDGYGNAEFSNVYVRGDINASSGTIGYWNISQPSVTRTFGDYVLRGTVIESLNLGETDSAQTSGTYVALFKSYDDIEIPITAASRESSIATITVTEHFYAVGDFVRVTVNEDSSFNTNSAEVIDVSNSSFSYISEGSDVTLGTASGSSVLAIKDVAGLYLRDYSKSEFDYGYFSNTGIAYVSAEDLNIIENPSFEYIDSGGLRIASTSSWTAGAGITFATEQFNDAGVGPQYQYDSNFGGRATWSSALSTYLSGKLDYSAGNSYNIYDPGRVLYLGITIFPRYTSTRSTPSSVSRYSGPGGALYWQIDTGSAHGLSGGDTALLDFEASQYDALLGESLLRVGRNVTGGFTRTYTVLSSPAPTSTTFYVDSGYTTSQTISDGVTLINVDTIAPVNTNTTDFGVDSYGTRPAYIYKVVNAAFNISDIRFRFNNGSTVNISEVLSLETLEAWDTESNKYYISDPTLYALGYHDNSVGIPYMEKSTQIIIDANLLISKYKLSDSTGYDDGLDIYIDFPGWMYTHDGAGYVSASPTKLSSFAYILDNLHVSTTSKSFFGGSLANVRWYSSTDDDPSYNPAQASVEGTKKWIDVNLDTQTAYLDYFNYVGFKQSNFSRSMFVSPNITTSDSISSKIVSSSDYETLTVTSGTYRYLDNSNSYIDLLSSLKLITGDRDTGFELVASKKYYTGSTTVLNEEYANIAGYWDEASGNSIIRLKAKRIGLYTGGYYSPNGDSSVEQVTVTSSGVVIAGTLTVNGNTIVNGTTTTVNSTTVTVDDKNIELASTASPSDALADGAGITVKGTAPDKTWNWYNATDAWTSNQDIDIVSPGTSYDIAGTPVLNATTLGSGVVNSSLTKIGALSGGTAGYVKVDASGNLTSTSSPATMASLTGYTSTAMAGGNTPLSNTSTYYQIFTGTSTTTQTVTLPATSTLALGWTFHIVNNSTGTGNLTVNSSGGNQVIVIPPGATAMATCINIAVTDATGWEAGLTDFSTYTGTGSVVLSASPTLSGTVTVNTGGTGVVGLVVKGASGQTADLLQLQDNSANVLGRVNASGQIGVTRLSVTSNASVSGVSRFFASASSATDVVAVIRGAASQSANLQEWQNSAGTVLASVNSSGDIQTSAAILGGTSSWLSATLNIRPLNSGIIGQVIRAVTSQSANLLELQDSSGNMIARFASNASLRVLESISAGAGNAPGGTYLYVQSWNITDVPMVVKGASGQTGDLQQWQNNSGTVLAEINNVGDIYLPNSAMFIGTTYLDAKLSINTQLASQKGVVIRGAASQLEDAFEVQNSAGTVLGGFSANAQIYSGSSVPLTTSTGAGINGVSGNGTTVTFSTTNAHNLANGDRVTISGLTPAGYNGTYIISGVSTFSFNVANTTTGAASGSGIVVVDAQASITARSAGTRGLIIRGVASHAVNLLEFQDNSENILAAVNGAGLISSTRQISVTQSNAGETMMFVRGAVSQTGDSFAVRDSSANTIAGFSATGRLYSGVSASGQTALGGLTLGGGSVASQLGIIAGSATTVGAVIRGASGQTADLLQAQTNTGTVLARIGAGGQLRLGTSIAGTSFAVNNDAFGASVIPAVIRGAASQTANLQEWQISDGTVRSYITADGSFLTASTLTTTQNLRVAGLAGTGGGSGVIAIANAGTVPSTNPSGGGVLYVDTGALRYRGTSGAAVTIVNADGTSPYPTLSGNNTFTGNQIWNNSVQLGPGLNASVGFEIGYTGGTATTPYIDFHSGATNIDYDSRIIASGGNGTNGQGTLTYTAATNTFTGTVTATSLIKSGGTSSQFLKADGSSDSNTYLATSTSSNLYGNSYFAGHNPEGRFMYNAYLANDMANARLRGSAVSATQNGVSYSISNANWDAMFDGTASFFNISPTSGFTFPLVITVPLPRTLTYGTWVGISFGSTSFRANSVKIEVFSLNSSSWVTVIDTASNTSEDVFAAVSGLVGGNSSGINQIRYTISNPNSTQLRLQHLWAYNFNSDMWSQTMMPRAGGSFYGSVTNTTIDPAAVPLTVKGATSQTADLLSAQNSAGSTLFSVASSGAVFTNSTLFTTLQSFIYGAGDYSAALNVQTRAVGNQGIVVRGRSSQSADLQQWQTSAGTVAAKVDASGIISTTSYLGITGTLSNANIFGVLYGTGSPGTYAEGSLSTNAGFSTPVMLPNEEGYYPYWGFKTPNIVETSADGTTWTVVDPTAYRSIFAFQNGSSVNVTTRFLRVTLYQPTFTFLSLVSARFVGGTNSKPITMKTELLGSDYSTIVSSYGPTTGVVGFDGAALMQKFNSYNGSTYATRVTFDMALWSAGDTYQIGSLMAYLSKPGTGFGFQNKFPMLWDTNKTTTFQPAHPGARALIVKAAATLTSTITNAVANGTTITYTTSTQHGFLAGYTISITGIVSTGNPSATAGSGFNLTNATIAAVTSQTTFTVTNALVDTYTSGGTLSVAQGANLQEWQNAAGTVIARIEPAGNFIISGIGVTSGDHRVGTSNYFTAALNVLARSTTERGIVVRGQSAQISNLQEWQDSAGTGVVSVSPVGQLFLGSGGIRGTSPIAINTQTPTGTTNISITTAAAHGVSVGQGVTISGVTPSGYNGSWTAQSGTTGSTLVVNIGSNPGAITVAGTFTQSPRLGVTALSSTNTPLVVRAASSQTVNLFEIQDSSGSGLAFVNNVGAYTTNSANGYSIAGAAAFKSLNSGQTMLLTAGGSVGANPHVVIRQSASQTGDLTQWQNSAGTTVFAGVSSAGDIFSNGSKWVQDSGGFRIQSTGGLNLLRAVSTTAFADSATSYFLQIGNASGTHGIIQSYAGGVLGRLLLNSPNVVIDNTGFASVAVPTAAFETRVNTTTQVGFILRGSNGQTANLQEWKSWDGTTATTVSYIKPDGSLYINSNANATGVYFKGTASDQSIRANGNDLFITPRFDLIYQPTDTTGRLRPANDNQADLGTSGQRWKTLFATGATLNGLTLTGTTSTITLNGSVGTSGQVLTSAGAGSTPTWTTVSGGSFTGGTLTSDLVLAAGSTTVEPLTFQSNSSTPTTTSGAMDYDGTVFYQTANTNPGRALATQNYYYVSSSDYAPDFSTSSSVQSMLGTATTGITVAAGTTYEYEFYATVQHQYITNAGVTGTYQITSTTVSGSPTVAVVHQIDYGSNTTGFTTATTLSTIRTTTSVVFSAAISSGSRYNFIRAKGVIRVTGTGTTEIYPGLSLSGVAGDNIWNIQNGLVFKLTPIGDGTVTTVGAWA